MKSPRNQLRIIGGQYRRRVLSFPSVEGLRPTPDRVRETLFNWLGQNLYGKTCLDLFAGSGALGFEAASREARRVLMVEQSRSVAQQLVANRQLLQANAAEVLNGDAVSYVSRSQEKFDIIFLDPPFHSTLVPQLLPQLLSLLSEGGVVYIETAHWPECPQALQVLRQGRAGAVCYGLLGRSIDFLLEEQAS